MRIIQFCSFLLAVAAVCSACGSGASSDASSPTEAYKKLFAAVKAKNIDEIKSLMSKKTQEFAEMAAQRQNATVEKVYSNGFTATTFSPQLPEIRDERVKDGFGAVEVWNPQSNAWEDIPFVLEDGQWKLAYGDTFAGSYKSPGKGRDQKEREAANAARGGMPEVNVNTNLMKNMNAAGPPNPAKNRAK
jgi:hypothetical protein